MLGPFEDLVRLESEEPLNELEPPGQVDQGLELLGKHHPAQMGLTIDLSRAVLDRLDEHPLPEDLADRIDVVQGGERRADGAAAAPAPPQTAPRRHPPWGRHLAAEYGEPAGPNRPPHASDDSLDVPAQTSR